MRLTVNLGDNDVANIFSKVSTGVHFETRL